MDLLSSTLGAVGQIGEGIDKFTGGRALRGAVAGKPRELASILPFSDTLGLTRPEDSTSGRDLTDMYGLTQKGDNSFGSHAAGFLADNVLSPANMLGAYGAFKAAPTIAKGLTQGAKALTGLDLLDHIGAGAKKLGGFLGGEAGSLRAPHVPPNPVDVGNMKETSLAANATRPRRYSTDPARKGWYQGDRTARFGRRFGGGPGNTAVPGGIPEFSLGDAIKRFGADESGAIRLPGDPGWDDALKAYEQHKHLVAPKGRPDDAFVDAIDALGLPRDVDNTVYHIRDNMADFGKPHVDGDEQIANSLWHVIQNAGEDFFGDETGSLHLPFDRLGGPPAGMSRSAPEWINNRTAHHGTGTAGLTADSLDPMKTDPGGLFGRGIYTTDSPELSGEYADARIGTAKSNFRSSVFAPGRTRQLLQEGAFTPDLLERMFATNYQRVPDQRRMRSELEYLMGGLSQQITGGALDPSSSPLGKEILDLYGDRFGHVELPRKTIYQGKSSYGKILDLESNLSGPERGRLVDSLMPVAEQADQIAHEWANKSGRSLSGDIFKPKLLGSGNRAEEIINAAREANAEIGNSQPVDALVRALKTEGYDALTHTGGTRVGQGKKLHQVTIGLDPNDKLGLGRATPYSIWEAMKDFGSDESGALKIPRMWSKPHQVMSRIGPGPKLGRYDYPDGYTPSTNDLHGIAEKAFGGVASPSLGYPEGSHKSWDFLREQIDSLGTDAERRDMLRSITDGSRSIHDYVGNSTDLNEALRRGDLSHGSLAGLDRMIPRGRLDSSMPPLIRGLGGKASRAIAGDLGASSLSDPSVVGKTFTDKGFGSYSFDPKEASGFGDYFSILDPSQSGVRGLPINPSQSEFLTPRNSRFQVTGHTSLETPWSKGNMNAMLLRFLGDDSGYLRHAIPGVPEDLANAMDGLGPQYPGGVDKLRSIVEGAGSKIGGSTNYGKMGDLRDRFNLLMQGPHAEGVASEIPEGSQFLGAGMEGIALRTPEGGVIRIGDYPNQANRPDIQEMLQAYREQRVGPYKVEHLPQVAPVHQEFDKAIKNVGKGQYSDELASAIGLNSKMNTYHGQAARHMAQSIAEGGLDPWDVSPWNVGMTPEGNSIIFDGGAVRPSKSNYQSGYERSWHEDPITGLSRSNGGLRGAASETTVDSRFSPKPTYDAPEGDLLRQVMEAGGPGKVRESLRQGLRMGTVGQGVMTPETSLVAALREEVQDYLSLNGVNPGLRAGWRASPLESATALESAGDGRAAPSMGKLLGTLGATGVGAGLLGYLLGGNQGQ